MDSIPERCRGCVFLDEKEDTPKCSFLNAPLSPRMMSVCRMLDLKDDEEEDEQGILCK